MIRSEDVRNLSGAPVLDSEDDKVGTVDQVFLDATTTQPSWITVHTGLFGRHASFVPLSEATFDGERLRVGTTKAAIKDAPRVDADGALSPEEEAQLFRYYGMADAGSAASEPDHREPDAAAPVTEVPAGDASGVHRAAGPVVSDSTRLKKYVVTEYQTVTVPVSHEELRAEPATTDDAATDAAPDDRAATANAAVPDADGADPARTDTRP